MLLGAIVLLVLLAAYALVLFNALVRLTHGVSKTWSNVDVMRKQRHEELPKLVETCKQYMQHERVTLEAVIAACQAVSSAQANGDINALGYGVLHNSAGAQLLGPLTNTPCLWWRYKIEEYTSSGKKRSWLTLESGSSEALLQLDDSTGSCLIDPRGAQVRPLTREMWKGSLRHPLGARCSAMMSAITIARSACMPVSRCMPLVIFAAAVAVVRALIWLLPRRR